MTLPDPPLPPELRADVADVVRFGVDAVRRALAGFEPAEPVYALSVSVGQIDLFQGSVFLGLESTRETAMRGPDGPARFYAVWGIEEYGAPDRGVAFPADGSVVLQAAERLDKGLLDAGVPDPSLWVQCRVARDLAQVDWPWPRTDDFVVYAFNGQWGNGFTNALRFSASPAALAILKEKGLLDPEAVDGLFAQLTELTDDEIANFAAIFECDIRRGEEFWESGPLEVPLAEALRWGREAADQVRLTVGDDSYSAGREPIPGLPVWDDARSIQPRPMR